MLVNLDNVLPKSAEAKDNPTFGNFKIKNSYQVGKSGIIARTMRAVSAVVERIDGLAEIPPILPKSLNRPGALSDSANQSSKRNWPFTATF